MAEFAYNHTKNASTSHKSFEINSEFYSHTLYKKDIDSHLQATSADELANKLIKLMF